MFGPYYTPQSENFPQYYYHSNNFNDNYVFYVDKNNYWFIILLLLLGVEARNDGYLESTVTITMPGSHVRTPSNPASPAPSLYSFVGVSITSIIYRYPVYSLLYRHLVLILHIQ